MLYNKSIGSVQIELFDIFTNVKSKLCLMFANKRFMGIFLIISLIGWEVHIFEVLNEWNGK